MAVNLVFLLLWITFALLGIADAIGSQGLGYIGGWFGIATALVAWYASFAVVMNKTAGRTVVPVKELK